MDRRVVVGAIAALALGGAVGFWMMRDPDEARIRAALARLTSAVRIARGESPVVRAARIQATFGDLLVASVGVDIAELPDARPGRMELVRLASAVAGAWTSLDAELSSVRVAIDPGGRSASVDATVALRGARGGGEERTDARAISLRFVDDGGWKVASVTVYRPREPD